jgi:hypothetical protein
MNRWSPPPPRPAARAGSRRGRRRKTSGLARKIHEGPNEPGQASERPARPPAKSPGRADERRVPEESGYGLGTHPTVRPDHAEQFSRHLVARAVGDGADGQRRESGSAGPGQHAGALHVNGQGALGLPPPRLVRRARDHGVHRHKRPDTVRESRDIERVDGTRAEPGVCGASVEVAARDEHGIADDDIPGPKARRAPASEPRHEHGRGWSHREDVEALEGNCAGTHGLDGQHPAGGRRQPSEQATGLQREAGDDEESTLARGRGPTVTAAVSPPPVPPAPPASGRARRRRTSRPRCPSR